jgi:Uncharacterised nucleotidyltransferase
MSAVVLKDFSWERMIAAVEEVRERACRAAGALNQAGIPHVVIGGHAVASWVARVDKEAVRNTKDVDLMVRREDFPRAIDILQSIGFIHQNVSGIDLFLDGPQGSVRSAIHIVFAGEKVRPDYAMPPFDIPSPFGNATRLLRHGPLCGPGPLRGWPDRRMIVLTFGAERVKKTHG